MYISCTQACNGTLYISSYTPRQYSASESKHGPDQPLVSPLVYQTARGPQEFFLPQPAGRNKDCYISKAKKKINT